MHLDNFDWDLITPEQAARIEETPGVLGGKPRIRGTRISISQVVGLVATYGLDGAAEQLRDIQPNLEDPADAVTAALRFAEVVLDRALPKRISPPNDWYDKVERYEMTEPPRAKKPE